LAQLGLGSSQEFLKKRKNSQKLAIFIGSCLSTPVQSPLSSGEFFVEFMTLSQTFEALAPSFFHQEFLMSMTSEAI